MTTEKKPKRDLAGSDEKRPQRDLAGSERAQWAWESVSQVLVDRDKKRQQRYGTLARRLPALLQGSGTGQTLAFLFAKADPKQPSQGAEGLLLAHLQNRIVKCFPRWTKTEGPLRTVIDLEPAQYRLVSRELAASADWLKRIVEGRIEKDETETP